LLDSGYALQKGFLPPNKKVCYHLKEFDESSPAMNTKELFNLWHSSLRITIERAFKVLKKRFHVLDAGVLTWYSGTTTLTKRRARRKLAWETKRDAIANAIWQDYKAQRAV